MLASKVAFCGCSGSEAPARGNGCKYIRTATVLGYDKDVRLRAARFVVAMIQGPAGEGPRAGRLPEFGKSREKKRLNLYSTLAPDTVFTPDWS